MASGSRSRRPRARARHGGRPMVFGRQGLEPGEALRRVRASDDHRQLGAGRPGVALPPALLEGRERALDHGIGDMDRAGVDRDPSIARTP